MRTPKPILDLVDRLRKACETEPAVEWDKDRQHWRIAVSNDRVIMTLDWKMTPGGRWVWASSTLTIDGVKGPLAQNFEHFVRVWWDPKEMANRVPVPPPIATQIQEMPIESMPSEISSVILKVVAKHNLFMSHVGYVDDRFWAVDFLFSRAVLRIHWKRTKNDPMLTEHVWMSIDGEDKSDLTQGKIEKALAEIAKIPHPGSDGPASINGSAGSQRDRGVEVRTTHVMRN